jgi:hypothetical protein
MAKKEENRPGTSEMAVVVFRLKGTDQTVQDGIKTISQAIHSMLKPSAPAQLRGVVQTPPADNDLDVESEIITNIDEESVDGEASPSEPQKKNSRVRKAATYTFVKDLNLRPDGKETLRDFYAAKGAANLQEQVTVIVYYLTRVLELSGVGANHIYTALKDVGTPVPPDIGQTLRLTAARKGWIDSSKGDDLKLAVSGENFVEHELPRKAAK